MSVIELLSNKNYVSIESAISKNLKVYVHLWLLHRLHFAMRPLVTRFFFSILEIFGELAFSLLNFLEKSTVLL